MENTYMIRITTATVEQFVAGEGASDTSHHIDIRLSQSVDASSVNRETVAETIEEMLSNKIAIDADDLDDSNEDFYLFPRIEDGGGNHTPDASEGYLVTYFIEVFQQLRACDIPTNR